MASEGTGYADTGNVPLSRTSPSTAQNYNSQSQGLTNPAYAQYIIQGQASSVQIQAVVISPAAKVAARKNRQRKRKGICFRASLVLVLVAAICTGVFLYFRFKGSNATNDDSNETNDDSNETNDDTTGHTSDPSVYRVQVNMELGGTTDDPDVVALLAGQLEYEVDLIFLVDDKLYKKYNFSKVVSLEQVEGEEKLTMRVFMRQSTTTSTIKDQLKLLIQVAGQFGLYFSLADESSLSVVKDTDRSFPDFSDIHIIPTASGSNNIGCDADEFSCKSGRCTNASTLCNGYSECFDGSDEEWRRCHDCLPLRTETIQDALPYTEAYFPNKVVLNEGKANEIMDDIQSYLTCHQYAKLYAAAIVAPSCPNAQGNIGTICRSFCRAVRMSCLVVERELLFHSITFDCSKLDNGPGCLTVPTTACHEMEFKCDNGRCIHIAKKCDSVNDCSDGSDEHDKYCKFGKTTCGDHEFLCQSDAKCIPIGWKHDGFLDCSDGADEAGVQRCSNTCSFAYDGECDDGGIGAKYAACTLGTDCFDCGPRYIVVEDTGCNDSQFQCNNGDCISSWRTCNGNNDCGDYSDESASLCAGRSCITNYYRCSSTYTCIHGDQQCDGDYDCQDKSDEMFCAQINEGSNSLSVNYNGVYRPVCIDGWNDTISEIVCNELGFRNVTNVDGYTNSYIGNPLKVKEMPSAGYFFRELVEESSDRCMNNEVVSLTCSDIMCGVRPGLPVQPSSRIVGGTPSASGAWPWIVSLQLESDGEYRHVCGANIIGDRWLVTAAHCFYEIMIVGNGSVTDVHAVVGVRDNTPGIHQPHGQIKDIEEYYIHPQYDYYSFQNDIAIVKLAGNITFNDHVRPICLASPNMEISVGRECNVAGWGFTQEDGESPPADLQETYVTIMDDSDCSQRLRDLPLNQGFQDGMLCAGHDLGGRDTCQGDSGGPLMCNNRDDGKWYLHGVTSFGAGCARQYFPSVYTKVSHYHEFINDIIGDEI